MRRGDRGAYKTLVNTASGGDSDRLADPASDAYQEIELSYRGFPVTMIVAIDNEYTFVEFRTPFSEEDSPESWPAWFPGFWAFVLSIVRLGRFEVICVGPEGSSLERHWPERDPRKAILWKSG